MSGLPSDVDRKRAAEIASTLFGDAARLVLSADGEDKGRPGWSKQPVIDVIAEALSAARADYEEVLADHRRLVRELDVIWNGEDGAAEQASLCDVVSQIEAELPRRISAVRAEQDVEQALVELREMYPGRAIIIRNGGRWPPSQRRPEFAAEVTVYGIPTVIGTTLAEAMAKVRGCLIEHDQDQR